MRTRCSPSFPAIGTREDAAAGYASFVPCAQPALAEEAVGVVVVEAWERHLNEEEDNIYHRHRRRRSRRAGAPSP